MTPKKNGEMGKKVHGFNGERTRLINVKEGDVRTAFFVDLVYSIRTNRLYMFTSRSCSSTRRRITQILFVPELAIVGKLVGTDDQLAMGLSCIGAANVLKMAHGTFGTLVMTQMV